MSGEQAIESTDNRQVKWLASLAGRKQRKRDGVVLVEGWRGLEQAMAFGARVDTVLVDRRFKDEDNVRAILNRVHAEDGRVYHAPEQVVRRAATTETSPGIVAAVASPGVGLNLDALPLHRMTRLLIVDGLQDPGNMGTMIRTAVAVKVDAVIITFGTVDPANPKALRASAGAYFGVPIVTDVRPHEWHAAAQKAGLLTVAADVDGDADAFQFDWSLRHALIIGSEARGIDASFSPDHRVVLPMPGGVQSLNAAMTATVLLYEAWRRGGNKHE